MSNTPSMRDKLDELTRVTDLSKELNLKNKDVVKLLNDLGHTSINHFANKLTDAQIMDVKNAVGKLTEKETQNLKDHIKPFFSVMKIDNLWHAVQIDIDIRDHMDDIKLRSPSPKSYKSAAIPDFENIINTTIYKREE